MNEQLKKIDLKFEVGQRVFYVNAGCADTKKYTIHSEPLEEIIIRLTEKGTPEIYFSLNSGEIPQSKIFATIEEANEVAIARLTVKRLQKNKRKRDPNRFGEVDIDDEEVEDDEEEDKPEKNSPRPKRRRKKVIDSI